MGGEQADARQKWMPAKPRLCLLFGRVIETPLGATQAQHVPDRGRPGLHARGRLRTVCQLPATQGRRRAQAACPPSTNGRPSRLPLLGSLDPSPLGCLRRPRSPDPSSRTSRDASGFQERGPCHLATGSSLQWERPANLRLRLRLARLQLRVHGQALVGALHIAQVGEVVCTAAARSHSGPVTDGAGGSPC